MSIILFLLCLTIIKSDCPIVEVTEEECPSQCSWTKTKNAKCEGEIDDCASLTYENTCGTYTECNWIKAKGNCSVKENIDSADDKSDSANYNSDSANDNSDNENDNSDSANDKSDSANDNSDSVNNNSDSSNDNSDSSKDNSDSANDNSDNANDNSDSAKDKSQTNIYRTIVISALIALIYFLLKIIIFIL